MPGVGVVDERVAVVVDAVAVLIGGRWVGRAPAVSSQSVLSATKPRRRIAVATSMSDDARVAVAVGVGVAIPGRGVDRAVFVDDRVAVVVDAVAVLRRAWVDRAGGVVAVRVAGDEARRLVAVDVGHAGVAVAVGVGVLVPGHDVDRRVLVDGTVTVVVDAVAVLICAGVDRVEAVVAVGVVGDVASRLVAGVLRDCGSP